MRDSLEAGRGPVCPNASLEDCLKELSPGGAEGIIKRCRALETRENASLISGRLGSFMGWPRAPQGTSFFSMPFWGDELSLIVPLCYF